MNSALIGHTGFVGGNLLVQGAFDDCFNSQNIAEISGRSYDLVVCTGVQAKKWLANKDPEWDWSTIQPLLTALEGVKAAQFCLISTIDVYPPPVRGNEDAVFVPEQQHAYGRHRYQVEQWVAERFPQHSILRLPGLFGDGLKKNVIYDLMHDNMLEAINPAGCFQYYSLDWIWADVQKALQCGLPLLNVSSGPVTTEEIIRSFFAEKASRVGGSAGPAGSYDFRSKHAALWSGQDGYLYSRERILEAMGDFIRRTSVS